MAEDIFKKMISDKGLYDNYEVDSAATSLEETGHNIYYYAKDCLTRHAIPFDHHPSRQVTKADYDHFDRLICMEDDASMYVLCAVAKKDTELLIEVRQISAVDMDKTYTDAISVSNLFRA